jgi:predicted transcriptional regulator
MLAIRPVSDSVLTIRVPRDVRDHLVALAVARDHTLSQEARKAFRLYLGLPENEPSADLIGA